jgi:PKD repeat protein
MRWIFSVVFFCFVTTLGAQIQTLTFDGDARKVENTEPIREIFDEGIYGVQVNYNFPGAQINSIIQDSRVFQNLYIKNFSHTQEIGKASLPSHIDIILVPQGSFPSIQLLSVDTFAFNNFLIYPALGPASDEYGAPNPEFIYDSSFYASGAFYPSSPVVLRELIHFKGMSIALVEVFPVQYLPSARKIYVHSEIKYKVNFTSSTQFIDINKVSMNTLKMLPNYVLNNIALSAEIQQYINNLIVYDEDPNYLIITHPDYLQAADSLADWKRRLGFIPEILVSSSWTSTSIRNEIYLKYLNYSPSPDYFVIIGDNDKVPGMTISSGNSNFATDLYYACMDGANDYIPDMAYGRISVNGAAQALNVVKKIINYERDPNLDSSFYSNGLNCAYFQHAGSGYAERRFAQTSEEIRTHIVNNGYNVDRVYYTESTVNPLFWNNGYYSAGESIPNYLKKPTFPWNGNAANINSHINNGRFYVFHRDHGMSSGWGDPYYTTSHINSLANGNKLPVVFSINCLTGKYMDAECFAEKFLRMPNGGAVGVFGHGEVSYSGYNDGLALGLIDAIWSNPGLIPNFTGSGGVQNPSLSLHNDIHRMGDVKNQGLIRMIESWGGTLSDIKYTHELFNYFGDPAMEIRTHLPLPILASVNDSIDCNNDTSLVISNSSFDGIVTLVVDDILVAKGQISNGNAILFFNSISGNVAHLTISGRDRIPFSKSIVISGGCPRVDFTVSSNQFCLSDSVLITNHSTGNIASYNWNFGVDALPTTATGIGPFYVKYLSAGSKNVVLSILDSNSNQLSVNQAFVIDQNCKHNIPSAGNLVINKCSGLLYDDGGIGNYSSNSLGSVTISPTLASTISLNFISFNFESGNDFLKIYDGPNTNSPLIGVFTGSNLPNNGQIVSSAGSITISQESDSYTNMDGFVLNWQCNLPFVSPVSNFSVSDSISCDGVVQFYDNSLNGPSNWLWDFGDGVVSSDKNPQHIYNTNGVYSVKLVVNNQFGVDSVLKSSIVQISRPNSLIGKDTMRCKNGSLNLSTNYTGNGSIYWYDSLNSTIPKHVGSVLFLPNISIDQTYFAEIHELTQSEYVGKKDNGGTGAYYTSNSSHYLIFDCYKPVMLKSVLVYASTAGSRTIQLLNSGGSLLMSKTVNIPSGQSRVTLDFEIPVGINLRLAGPTTPNLYRNDGFLAYPFEINNSISIKKSSATSNPTGYYYYFYDWEIIEGECVSVRVPIRTHVLDSLSPVADFSFVSTDPYVSFNYTGDFADNYYWDFGDGDFSLLQNPNHLFQSNGVFNVKLIVSNACGQTSITKSISILSANLQTSGIFERIEIFPIPTDKTLNIRFDLTKGQTIQCVINDMTGRSIRNINFVGQSGQNQFAIDVSDLARGLYTIKLDTKEGFFLRKFIITDR